MTYSNIFTLLEFTKNLDNSIFVGSMLTEVKLNKNLNIFVCMCLQV